MTKLRDAQIAGKASFLYVCVKVFLEAFDSVDEKRDTPSPMWAGIAQSVEAPGGTKSQRKGNFALSF